MDQDLLKEIYDYLDQTQKFLVDCDDGLAGEVSAKDKIAGRIYKAANDMPRLKLMVKNLQQR